MSKCMGCGQDLPAVVSPDNTILIDSVIQSSKTGRYSYGWEGLEEHGLGATAELSIGTVRVEQVTDSDYESFMIISITKNADLTDLTYYKKTASTSSYGDGEYLSGLEIVTPTTKTVTVFE